MVDVDNLHPCRDNRLRWRLHKVHYSRSSNLTSNENLERLMFRTFLLLVLTVDISTHKIRSRMSFLTTQVAFFRQSWVFFLQHKFVCGHCLTKMKVDDPEESRRPCLNLIKVQFQHDYPLFHHDRSLSQWKTHQPAMTQSQYLPQKRIPP